MSPQPHVSSECFRSCIVEQINKKQAALDQWLAEKEIKIIVPPHTSIDLRDSGFKACPVDSNVFPGGFNNICREDWDVAATGFRKLFERNLGKELKRIIIVPENHTKNQFYFENVLSLQGILKLAGYDVVVGHVNDQLTEEATEVATASGRTVLIEKLHRNGETLATATQIFTTNDLVLLNNDLSNGVPTVLENLANRVLPSPKLGWHLRKKSTHLLHYNQLASEVAEILDIDPFHITPRFSFVKGINFQSGEGIEELAKATETMLMQIKSDYDRHQVKDVEPFVFIKHNSGTYGRSIMQVKSSEEVLSMNRRAKNKMHISKGGVQVDDVILMEGIPTSLTADEETAEPVIYLAGSEPIGGFLRLNPNRDSHGNLNSPGAHFKTLCFANLLREQSADTVVLEKFYGLLGKLSTLANGLEMQ